MGWIRKLDSGKYQALYRGSDGKVRSVGTFAHKRRAERESEIAEGKARGTYWRSDDGKRTTWGKFADEVWWPLHEAKVAENTARKDAARRRTHLGPWEDVPVGAINRMAVRTWVAKLQASEMSAASVRLCVALLSSSLNAAVDAEVIDFNPALRLGLAKGATDQERFFTRGEYEALCFQMPTERDLLILQLLVNTGLRWGELAGLHRARVDTARQMIRVVETYSDETGKMKATPKGKRSRDVPLPAWLAAKIDRLTFEPGDCGVEHPKGTRCPGPLLISSRNGTPVRNSNWARVYKAGLRHAGLGDARIHDCRHTYASWLLQQGIDIAEVSKLLGHSSITVTERYAHLAATPSTAVLAALGGAPAVDSAARLLHPTRSITA